MDFQLNDKLPIKYIYTFDAPITDMHLIASYIVITEEGVNNKPEMLGRFNYAVEKIINITHLIDMNLDELCKIFFNHAQCISATVKRYINERHIEACTINLLDNIDNIFPEEISDIIDNNADENGEVTRQQRIQEIKNKRGHKHG